MRWREDAGESPPPRHAFDVRAPDEPAEARGAPTGDDADDDADDDAGIPAGEGEGLELARELIEKTAHAAIEQLGAWAEDLGQYLDNARWQLPRLARLRHLQDDSLISAGR